MRTHHTQARVLALPMLDHALVEITVVDAPSVDMPVVGARAGVTAVVDVRAAATTVTRNPPECERPLRMSGLFYARLLLI
jgi:hypothetical protein